jgi:hypothetical protein
MRLIAGPQVDRGAPQVDRGAWRGAGEQVSARFIQPYVAYFDAQRLTDAWLHPGAERAGDSTGSPRPPVGAAPRVIDLATTPDSEGIEDHEPARDGSKLPGSGSSAGI